MRTLPWLAAAVLSAGCTAPSGSSAVRPVPTAPPAASAASAASVPVVASGHGWSGRHLDGPTHPAGACHLGGTTAKPLPDPACTPGATDAAVSGGTIATTICVHGYTATVRPPASVTGPAKRESRREYGYTGPGEYDHLIPLELGGASDTRNLWVEPGPIPNAKDKVEGALKVLVCTHKITLVEAQRAIATNWSTALAVVKAQQLN